MKLLQPRELNTKIQEQNSSEAKAGLFLAKKVDALREQVQDAQREHEIVIEALKKEFISFTEEQQSIKDSILKEICSLKEEKRILEIPLDEEWKKVREESDKNTDLSFKLIEREFNVKKDEEFISKKLSEIAIREENIELSERKTALALIEAGELRQKAQKDSDRATEIKETSQKDSEIRNSELKQKETDILYREVDAENKWKNALQKEEANIKETKRIESKQRQLSAAFAELKKRNEQS
jgi:hypothetical protein